MRWGFVRALEPTHLTGRTNW